MHKNTSAAAVPTISVIMPAYNVEKYIADAIQSILDQSFKDFQLIILNDGSTDKTAEIVSGFDDPRIVFVDNAKNAGLVAVLNQGLDMARTEFIARMDSDDISMPERFQKQVDFLRKHPEVSMVGSFHKLFGEQNHTQTFPEHVGILQLLRNNCISHPSVMWRRADFEKHELKYNPEYIHAEDYELWTRAARNLKIINMQEVLYKYRWHSGQVSQKHEAIQKESANRIKQDILDFLTSDKELQKRITKDVREWRWVGIFFPLIKVVYRRKETVWKLLGLLTVKRKRKIK